MSNRTETPAYDNPEIHKTPEGRPVEVYANGKIRVYAGHTPKTTIDIPEFNTHVTIHKYDPFEFNKAGEVSRVSVRKGHNRGKLVVAFGDPRGGKGYEYDVFSPEGIIGSAHGKRLDLLIGSLFYNDTKLTEFIKDCSMDDTVKRHLKFAIIAEGNRMHNNPEATPRMESWKNRNL